MLEENLTKDVQGLYTEDYKTLRKEIKEDLNNYREIYHIHALGDILVVPTLI